MSAPTRRQLLAGALGAAATAVLGGCASEPLGVRRQVYSYGPAPEQVAELWQPPRADGLVVLLHGGYWHAGRRRSAVDRIALDLVGRGWAVWNLDYRGVGEGGGWPTTFTDVAAGADLLADAAREHGLLTRPLVTVGHSAGGTLALWLAARASGASRTAGQPWGPARLPVAGAVSLAGVDDLTRAAELDLGPSAVANLVGGTPEQVPDRYGLVDPIRLVPLRVPLLVVVGSHDRVLPVAQSTAFVSAARAAGDDVRLDVVPAGSHGTPADVRSPAWRPTVDWLAARRSSPVTTLAPAGLAQRR